MTIKVNAFVHAACMSLLLMLVPGPAVAQEQKEPPAQQPEKTVAEPAPQQSGSLITPSEGTGAAEEAEPAAAPAPVSPAAAVEETPPASATIGEYAIKQGDTLWDIANAFYKDPFLWPFIWKANPSIANPDLIYAGATLTIPDLAPMERALQAQAPAKEEKAQPAPVEREAVQEAPPEPKAVTGIAAARATKPRRAQPQTGAEETTAPEGSRLIIPEEQQQPIIDKYSMLSAGFVNMEPFNGEIVGAEESGKTIMGYDDIVYVKISPRERVNVGDKYLIFAPLGKVRHPITYKRFGQLIRGLGILQITANDPSADVLTARITLSFDAIEMGRPLAPYQEPTLIYPSSQKKAKDISGYILEVTDGRTINAQTDVVYLDKGSLDGVDRGDRFIVYADPEKRGFPRKIIGEVQVFLVKDHSATAVVSRSKEALATGNAFDFKK